MLKYRPTSGSTGQRRRDHSVSLQCCHKKSRAHTSRQKLRVFAQELNFELLELEYDTDAEGNIPPELFPDAMAEIKEMGAEAIYVGSSSYNLGYRDIFVRAALDQGLPIFSGYK